MRIPLSTGQLHLRHYAAELSDLSGFGSRMNLKRGFVFVSRVLGKHWPARPSAMQAVHRRLAVAIQPRLLPGPSLVIGFAETATGLGWGVYEALAAPDSFYTHTTRYRLEQPVWLAFQEEHCHAPSHILYQPADPALWALRERAVNVVLVDDEFSTGRTLANLVRQLQPSLPCARRFIGAGILDWTESAPPGIELISLHQGRFEFEPLPAAQQAAVTAVSVPAEDVPRDALLPHNFGRRGRVGLNLPWGDYVRGLDWRGRRILVLGTGEFMHPAFGLGLYLEQGGAEVYVQATSRSPLNVDADIHKRLNFVDNYHEEIDNFLYNIDTYDIILVCYETPRLPARHDLKQQLAPHAQEVVELFMEPD